MKYPITANIIGKPKLQGHSRKLIKFMIMFSLTLIAGCATNVTVEATFPKPIVNQLPFSLGVFYPPEFRDYTYTELSETRDERTINIGGAQTSLFNTVLPALFKQVQPVSQAQAPQSSAPLDLVMTMTVDDFQYTVPSETRIDMYEVWVKYNLQLLDPQGQLIADWILTAYGKTPSELMKSESEAITQAMIVALRDAGANFALSFNKVPEIRQWLERKNQQQAQSQI